MNDTERAVPSRLPRLRRVRAGVYVFEQAPGGWCAANCTLVTAGRESLLIDSPATQERALRLRSEIIRSGLPLPRKIVTTHHHGDHHFGNFVFPEATVYGHKNCPGRIYDAGLGMQSLFPNVDWGEIRLRPPTQTFDNHNTIVIGDMDVEMFNYGTAHTDNDTLVWISTLKTLVVGDIAMSGRHPYLLMGSVAGSTHTLSQLEKLPAECVIPGHGPLGDKALVAANRVYFDHLRSLATRSKDQDLSLAAASALKSNPFFFELEEPERLLTNLAVAVQELSTGFGLSDKQQAEAFIEMCKFHGAPPAAAI